MAEGWWEKRIDAEIEQLRRELREVQRHRLEAAIITCVAVQVIGLFVVAVLAASNGH